MGCARTSQISRHTFRAEGPFSPTVSHQIKHGRLIMTHHRLRTSCSAGRRTTAFNHEACGQLYSLLAYIYRSGASVFASPVLRVLFVRPWRVRRTSPAASRRDTTCCRQAGALQAGGPCGVQAGRCQPLAGRTANKAPSRTPGRTRDRRLDSDLTGPAGREGGPARGQRGTARDRGQHEETLIRINQLLGRLPGERLPGTSRGVAAVVIGEVLGKGQERPAGRASFSCFSFSPLLSLRLVTAPDPSRLAADVMRHKAGAAVSPPGWISLTPGAITSQMKVGCEFMSSPDLSNAGHLVASQL
ncbi:Hypothetical predicted protein [Olea europaea subsp. europaea]|uniref:Uncharacterized protein n=1 Tax=Olea europaea subsp. europaea TaxID=158383 RepID=A0A8S0RCY1_OLEEU|nr:Hypothetical predicted protein [Olea europaea subsp. europaea]